LLLCGLCNLLDLALAEQCRRSNRSHPERPCGNDIDADGFCEALGLLGTRLRGPPRRLPRQLRDRDDRAFTSRDVGFAVTVVVVQDSAPSSPSTGCSVARFSG
jgi:hypothetical protein